MQVRSLGQEDPLEDGMAIHSSILSWRMSWAEESGGRQSIKAQRVGHDRSDLACGSTGRKTSKIAEGHRTIDFRIVTNKKQKKNFNKTHFNSSQL